MMQSFSLSFSAPHHQHHFHFQQQQQAVPISHSIPQSPPPSTSQLPGSTASTRHVESGAPTQAAAHSGQAACVYSMSSLSFNNVAASFDQFDTQAYNNLAELYSSALKHRSPTIAIWLGESVGLLANASSSANWPVRAYANNSSDSASGSRVCDRTITRYEISKLSYESVVIARRIWPKADGSRARM
ncbi:hypothetical protein AX774_g7952 [Zancudomyces culisetae]|uniref:Uncharacterized protein n=1 Tax=Zancudomyces culisetae TaxID=1213189 RepID=A0A1R1PCE7_ZANCU|nr:hypothetical protein AX774_g7952 [Zancudomyces culisetae]|eukprot:OMH78646.1 hypothetical protein AX774_g7952 [Zancudomyces culisetae]